MRVGQHGDPIHYGRAMFTRRIPQVVEGAPATVTFATRQPMGGCTRGYCNSEINWNRGTASFIW
jgi:hypothetical protein